jgi:hypothetical protein
MWPDAARQLNLDHRFAPLWRTSLIEANHARSRHSTQESGESVRAAKRTHGLRVQSSTLTRIDWYLDPDTSKAQYMARELKNQVAFVRILFRA